MELSLLAIINNTTNKTSSFDWQLWEPLQQPKQGDVKPPEPGGVGRAGLAAGAALPPASLRFSPPPAPPRLWLALQGARCEEVGREAGGAVAPFPCGKWGVMTGTCWLWVWGLLKPSWAGVRDQGFPSKRPGVPGCSWQSWGAQFWGLPPQSTLLCSSPGTELRTGKSGPDYLCLTFQGSVGADL